MTIQMKLSNDLWPWRFYLSFSYEISCTVLVMSKLKHCTYKFCLKPKVTACLHGNHHALFAWYQNICEISFVNYVVNFNCTGGFDFAIGIHFVYLKRISVVWMWFQLPMGISLLFIDLMFGLSFYAEHNDIMLAPMVPHLRTSSYGSKAF